MGRPFKQFCPKGHDKLVVGVTSQRHCYACNQEKALEYRQRNPEKIRELSAKGYERFKNDPIRKKAHAVYKRRWKLQREYNLTEADEQALLAQQDNRCAICKKSGLKLHVDHNHRTNKVRGLLCGNCNRGLGVFYDSPESLQEAIQYLRTSEESTLCQSQ